MAFSNWEVIEEAGDGELKLPKSQQYARIDLLNQLLLARLFHKLELLTLQPKNTSAPSPASARRW